MKSPAEDIKDVLESSAVGIGTFGTDLFVSKEPSEPDACTTIYDTPGQEPEAGYRYDRPGVQVRVRGTAGGYQAAYAKIEDVKEALHGLGDETWNGTRYVGIWATGDPNFLGYDDNGRPIFTINFRVHRTA